MTAPAKGINLTARDSVEALGDHWGHRGPVRSTYGSPERTRLFGLLDSRLAWEQKHPDPRAHIPGLKEVRDSLAAGFASELGWDTDRLISAIGASKTTTAITQNNQPKETQN